MAFYSVVLSSRVGILSADDLVAKLTPVFSAAASGNQIDLELDLSSVTGFYPTGLAMVCACVSYLRTSGVCLAPTIKRPKNQDVDGYINRIGFYRFLDIDIPYTYQERNPKGKFCEIQRVDSSSSVDLLSGQWKKILEDQCQINDSSTLNGMGSAISEVLENVFFHADSPVDAIFCAQAYKENRQIELAIVDCGRGFLKSLRNNPAYRDICKNSAQAVRLSCEQYVSSTNIPGRGNGLYYTKGRLVGNKGTMYIRSYDGRFLVDRGVEQKEHLFYNTKNCWLGSIVALLINTDLPLDMKSFFDDEHPEDADLFVPYEG